MEDEDGACNTGLCLGLGLGGYVPKKKKKQITETNQVVGRCLDLRFELCPRGDQENIHNTAADNEEEENGLFRVKRMDHDNANNNSTKKLRLTKDQSALLEESFKLHTTLNPSQKHSLAEKLNLRPRQVEVWFQNRRARTKLKQTETDCEFLKKCCENLRDENRRLKRDLQELRALRVGMTTPSPLFIQVSKTTAMAAAETATTTCSSCQKRFKANDANNNNNNNKSKNSSKHSKLESVALDCYVG